jgi:hypothetical protein
VRVRLDRRRYPSGKKISKKELRELKVEPEEFHDEVEHRAGEARAREREHGLDLLERSSVDAGDAGRRIGTQLFG